MFTPLQKLSKTGSLPLILKVVAVLAALTATPMSASADIDAESGRLQITLVKTRYGGSSGILFYQGHKYGLAISGTQLKGVWTRRIDLIGDALNLRSATDIVGTFIAVDGRDATLGHAKTARLESPKGVILEIRGVNLNRKFTLNLSGMIIKNVGWETSSHASAQASGAQTPSTQRSPTAPPTPGPMLQQLNQMDRALEQLQDLAEEEEDLLKILD